MGNYLNEIEIPKPKKKNPESNNKMDIAFLIKKTKKVFILLGIILILVLTYVVVIKILEADFYDYTGLENVIVSESGSMVPNSSKYSLYCISGNWIAVKERTYGFDPKNNTRTEVNVDKEFVEKIIDLMKTNHVSKWEANNDGPNYNIIDKFFSKILSEKVYDGSNFTLSAKFSDGKTVTAYSGEPFPDRFSAVLSGFQTLYRDIS